MKVKHFNDPNQFLELILDLFKNKEDRFNLLLSLVKRITENPTYYEKTPLMSVVSDQNQVVLVAFMTTPPRDLILAATKEYPAAALDVLANDLWQQGLTLHGVNAEKKLSAAFAHLWAHRGAYKSEIVMRHRIYRLDRVVSPTTTSGFLRPATEQDKLVVLGWTNEFMREAMGEENPQHAEKLVDFQIQTGNLFVWDDDQIVSMAAKTRETIHGAVIGMVYTPIEYRGKGYASNLVAGLSDRFLLHGYSFCALFTDLANPTSNSIYQKIGYYPVADNDQYVFSKEL